MRGLRGTQTPNGAAGPLPYTSPGTLWLVVFALTLLFLAHHWRSAATVKINGPAAAHLVLPAQPAAPLVQPEQQALQQQPLAGGAVAGSAHTASYGSSPPADKVLLELFVMSLCPDASFCEHYFDKLLEGLHPIVHIKAHYIQAEGRNGRVQCKHGPEECRANMHQLCVQRHTPIPRSWDGFLKFLVCTWETGPMRMHSPALLKKCLIKVGADDGVRRSVEACVKGSEGKELMRQSAAIVARRGVERSCTVAIEGKKRCIRDGRKWYDCEDGHTEEDFTRSICDAHKAKTGREDALCAGLPAGHKRAKKGGGPLRGDPAA